MEYDKDRIYKTKSPDVFIVWFRNHKRSRVDDKRTIGELFKTEVDCYEKRQRTVGAWFVFEDGKLRDMNMDVVTKESGFENWDVFFRSTVCKPSNDFYKRPQPSSDSVRWYEFWKR